MPRRLFILPLFFYLSDPLKPNVTGYSVIVSVCQEPFS